MSAAHPPGDGAVPAPCRVVAMEATDHELLLVVEAGGRSLPVMVALSPPAVHALRHVCALHGHDRGCPADTQVHVDLLRRALWAAGAWPLCLLIRPDPVPAFWLRVATREGTAELALDVLDAAALLLSGRLPAAMVSAQADVWETTVERLLDGGRQ